MAASRKDERLIKRLLAIDQEIERHKARTLELRGELKAINKQLEEELGVTSLDDAEEKINELASEVEKLQNDLDELLDELEEAMA